MLGVVALGALALIRAFDECMGAGRVGLVGTRGSGAGVASAGQAGEHDQRQPCYGPEYLL